MSTLTLMAPMIIMDSASASVAPTNNMPTFSAQNAAYILQNQSGIPQLPTQLLQQNASSNNTLVNNFATPPLMSLNSHYGTSNAAMPPFHYAYRNPNCNSNSNMTPILHNHSQQAGVSSAPSTPNPPQANNTLNPPTSTSSINRSQRCGVCRGCQCKPCGTCTYCQDSPQFGGPGVKKQSCIERRCLRVLENRLQRDAPTFKARIGCRNCDDCLMPDCQICLVCLDKRFFNNRYMTGALCAKKRCNNATTLELGNNNNSGNVIDRHQQHTLKRSYENANCEQMPAKRRGTDHKNQQHIHQQMLNINKLAQQQQQAATKALQQQKQIINSPGRNPSKSPNNEIKNGNYADSGAFNGPSPLQESNCGSGKKFTGFRATNNGLVTENNGRNGLSTHLISEQQHYANQQQLLSIPVTSSCINNGQIQQQFVNAATSLPNSLQSMGYANTFPQPMTQFDVTTQMAAAAQQQQFLAYQQYQQKFLNYPKYEYYDEQNFVNGGVNVNGTIGNNGSFQQGNGMLGNGGVGFNNIPPQDPFVPPSYSEMKNAVVLQPL